MANCKRHDAAPVLFGRAASAADQVRRLGSLNAKLAGQPRMSYFREHGSPDSRWAFNTRCFIHVCDLAALLPDKRADMNREQ